MNTENAALSDEKVRKAIQKAIDVDMIIDAAFFGIPKRSTGIIAPGLLDIVTSLHPPAIWKVRRPCSRRPDQRRRRT
jgi:peptide/nickel transport system substrate-binding protein